MTTPKPPSQPDCEPVANCIELCTARSVYVEDEGVRATFLNPKRQTIRKIRYDGCYNKKPGRQADFIVGQVGAIDVIVELKGTDANLKDAAVQVESTLDAWQKDRNAEKKIAALIVYGRIEGKKKLPGRAPRTAAVALGLEARFLKAHGRRLLIRANGQQQFAFSDFLPRR